jgi:23S rRNA (cytidine2498-2'-O)-methyltransferase
MHLFLPADPTPDFLRDEIRRTWPAASVADAPNGLLQVHDLPDFATPPAPLAFARQCLPEAQVIHAPSIRALADLLFDALVPVLPESQPWRLHSEPRFALPEAGHQRCRLIRDALIERLQRQRRHLLRRLEPDAAPFHASHALVQLLLTEPEHGFLSVARAPLPHLLRRLVSPFPRGELPVASDKSAPCRAFAKLVEAEQRLGRPLGPGETCVDLGACPGSWTYVALQRGTRVTAVDRSPLRPDLMRHPLLTFHRGDAFTFTPPRPVDWLLCDVIAAPDRSIDLVLEWCRKRLCRHFVVTIKFKGTAEYPVLERLKAELAPLTSDFTLTRLCANKNEVCVMGSTG